MDNRLTAENASGKLAEAEERLDMLARAIDGRTCPTEVAERTEVLIYFVTEARIAANTIERLVRESSALSEGGMKIIIDKPLMGDGSFLFKASLVAADGLLLEWGFGSTPQIAIANLYDVIVDNDSEDWVCEALGWWGR